MKIRARILTISVKILIRDMQLTGEKPPVEPNVLWVFWGVGFPFWIKEELLPGSIVWGGCGRAGGPAACAKSFSRTETWK